MISYFERIVQDAPPVPEVFHQEPHELYTAFCLMRGYDSFLEIGSHFGTSFYILSHALNPGARVVSIDLAGDKTVQYLNNSIKLLNNRGYKAELIKGNSQEVEVEGEFDVIFIDGDHSYDGVKADVEKYSPKCKELLLLHDIRMDGPGRVLTEMGGGLRFSHDIPSGRQAFGYGARFTTIDRIQPGA